MHARTARQAVLRLVLQVTLVVVAFGFAVPARAAQPGLNSDVTWGIDPATVSQEIAATTATHVRWIRATLDLSGAESNGPQLNPGYLTGMDQAIQNAHDAGLNVLLELDRTPYWASADPNKYTDAAGSFHWSDYWKYADPAVYGRIVSDVVDHYKTLGIHAFEVWNEPNNSAFWPSGVNAAEYVSLLRAAYPAIKAADPSATVVMGGLMNDGAHGAYSYLQGIYDAGGRGNYDVANFHIYPAGDPAVCTHNASGRPADDTFCLLGALRSEMTAHGDSAPAWITELGWSTCAQSFCVTPQQQASDLTSAFNLLAGTSYSWVQKAFVYQTRDLYWATSHTSWDSSLGLMNRDFTPKPAYAALQAIGAAGGTMPTPPAPQPIRMPSPATSPTKSGSPSRSTRGHSRASAVVSNEVRLVVAHRRRVEAGRLMLRVRRHGHRVIAAGSLRLVHAARSDVSERGIIVIQRWAAGRWRTARVMAITLRRGHFARRFSLRRGIWRLWARVASHGSPASKIRIG